MNPPKLCPWCGEAGSGDSCIRCARPTNPSSRDRVEADLGRLAAVSDRGRHRIRNEDAIFVGVRGAGCAAVVCDGVGSAAHGNIAAQVAADAAGAELLAAVDSYAERLADTTRRAIVRAGAAVAALPQVADDRIPAPASTLVSVACRNDEITVGWAGDSRCYWLGPEGPRLVTRDDTWASHQLQVGQLTAAEVASFPRRSAITNWLGADTPSLQPHVASMRPRTRGRLIVCSDGLWRYLPTLEDLAEATAETGRPQSPMSLAVALTSLALAAGGHDNITVAVLDFDPRPEASHG